MISAREAREGISPVYYQAVLEMKEIEARVREAMKRGEYFVIFESICPQTKEELIKLGYSLKEGGKYLGSIPCRSWVEIRWDGD